MIIRAIIIAERIVAYTLFVELELVVLVTVELGRVPLVVPLVEPPVDGRVLGLTPELVVALQTI